MEFFVFSEWQIDFLYFFLNPQKYEDNGDFSLIGYKNYRYESVNFFLKT